MGATEPLKLRKNFVLDATPMKHGVFRVWLPGGKVFHASMPKDGRIERLPSEIPWNRRVSIAHGFKSPGGNLGLLAYDIESIVLGPNPNPAKDTLQSLAWWGDTGYFAIDCNNDEDRIKAIELFCDAIERVNPDVIAGYFGNRYDLPVLIKEARRLGIPLPMGRDGAEPQIIMRRGGSRFDVKKVFLPGRIHFDVYDEVRYDQSLIGIRRGLKAVSKHLKLPGIIEEEGSSISKLTMDRRLKYNLSDARLTYILAKMYLGSLVALSERLEIPLTLAVERTPTHIGDYFYGRPFLDSGDEFAGDNQTRHKWVFDRKGNKYQGAHTELLRTGLFVPAYKLDFNSLYPGTMAMLNLDPDTIRLVKQGPHLGDLPPVFFDGGMTVQDDKLGSMTFEVCAAPASTTKIELLKLLTWKGELKPQSKVNAMARSKYWVVKLILNALYGYHGSPWSKWGTIYVAVITCAVGRMLVRNLRDLVEPNGLELDTDGIMGHGDPPDVGAIEDTLRALIPEVYQRDLIQLDVDLFEGMLSVDEKNYITKEKGKLKFHGSGLKGRHMPKVVSAALYPTIDALFLGADWREALVEATGGMESLPLSAFILSSDLGKSPSGYAEGNMYGKLARQLEASGTPVSKGDSIRFVKIVDGYIPSSLMKGEEIDYLYYKKRLAKSAVKALSAVEPELKHKDVVKVILG